jgi:pimeloyl-ACP methyl ester carboxylesterase
MADGRSTWGRRLLRYFGVVLAVYVGLCVAARVLYPRILFPAPRVDRAPHEAEARLVELAQDDGGGATRAVYLPAPPGGRTVVMFHGNGETMFDGLTLAEVMMSKGMGAMLVEYRGYGLTYGEPPTEASLYADGEAAMKYLARAGVSNDRIAVWGFSLGTSIASEMARRGHGARLALVAPFTSMIDMGRHVAPILPASLILAHHLDTYGRAKDIAQPTLVVHGDADEVVPFAMGERIAKALPHGEFVRVPGAHHTDLLTPDVLDRITTYLSAP